MIKKHGWNSNSWYTPQNLLQLGMVEFTVLQLGMYNSIGDETAAAQLTPIWISHPFVIEDSVHGKFLKPHIDKQGKSQIGADELGPGVLFA